MLKGTLPLEVLVVVFLHIAVREEGEELNKGVWKAVSLRLGSLP
jgi:hypothetical protein